MKKLLFCSSLIALLQLPVSCALMDDAAQTGTALKFDKVYFYPHPSDVPGCSQVIASTSMSGGGNYTEYIMLSFCFYETTEVGKELELERMMFGLPWSSDSRDYVHSSFLSMSFASVRALTACFLCRGTFCLLRRNIYQSF